MKKTLLLLLVLACTNHLLAQDEEKTNNYVVGGTLGLTAQDNSLPFSTSPLIPITGGIFTSSSNESNFSSFHFTPYFGKQINKSTIVGLQLSYLGNKNERLGLTVSGSNDLLDLTTKEREYGIGLFTRYSFNPESRLQFYIQPSISYLRATDKTFVNGIISTETKAEYFNISLSAGLLYDINDRFRATLRTGALAYTFGSWDNMTQSFTNDFSVFNANMSLSNISLGLEVKL